jgi:hypothetical protein
MTKFMYSGLILSVAVLLTGCGNGAPPSEPVPEAAAPAAEQPADAVQEEGTVSFSGTVAYKEFEGGFFAIDADDGAKYNPRNLPEHLAVDGQRVTVTARVRDDMVGIHMYGSIVDIIEIVPEQ